MFRFFIWFPRLSRRSGIDRQITRRTWISPPSNIFEMWSKSFSEAICIWNSNHVRHTDLSHRKEIKKSSRNVSRPSTRNRQGHQMAIKSIGQWRRRSRRRRKKKRGGPDRGSNPEPLAPKARIIPLDHQATLSLAFFSPYQAIRTRFSRT